MKKLSFRIAAAAFLIAIGTMSLSAQIGRGGVCLNTGVTTVVNRTCPVSLTADQQAILDVLRVEFQAEMDVLRAEMRSATFIDKLAIRKTMVELRTAHLAEVKALLEEWGL
jgi:hypothetical protein